MNQNGDNWEAADDISLSKSGLFYKLLVRLHLDKIETGGLAKRSLFLAAVTWVPLLILTALQGLTLGNKVQVSFLEDFTAHTRFLLAIPLMVFAETSVDFRLRELISQFFKAGILSQQDYPQFESIKAYIKKKLDSVSVDLIILMLVVTNIVFRWSERETEFTNWVILPHENRQSISWAGLWYACFSLPIVQFMILRWLWRWVVWFIFFYRISRMPLKLNAAHPDKSGGLGFLGIPPAPFLQVTLTFSILIAVALADQIYFRHNKLSDFYIPMGTFAGLSIIINILPLLVFSKPLLVHRRKGIFEFSALTQEHHRQFADKWLKPHPGETPLGNPDISSLADINASFETILSMRAFPFDLKTMLSSIVIAILPMIPLFAFEYDIIQVLMKVVSLLM
jgi:hypothetical protein